MGEDQNSLAEPTIPTVCTLSTPNLVPHVSKLHLPPGPLSCDATPMGMKAERAQDIGAVKCHPCRWV